MRRPLCFALILSALAASAPAGAQIVGHRHYDPAPPQRPFIADSRLLGPSAAREARHLREEVDQAQGSGAMSRGAARALRREARRIARLHRRYARDGLSQSEAAELEARIHALRSEVSRPAR